MVEGQAPRRSAARSLLLGAWLCLLLGAAPQSPCAPWPDEPTPLPNVRDADPLRARWAALRLRELGEMARALEPEDPAQARAIWQHASCIASGDAAVTSRATERLAAVVLHRPEVVRREPDAQEGNPWVSLSAPIAVGAPPAPRSPARAAGPSLAAVDALVAETAQNVRTAHFEAALASAERARRGLASLPREARASRSARLEVWAATADLALGREADARTSLSRALESDPALQLDAATPPKVRRALEAVRAESAR